MRRKDHDGRHTMRQRMIQIRNTRWLIGSAIAAFFLALGVAFTLAQEGASSHVDDAPPGQILWGSATAKPIPVSPALLARGRLIYGVRCATCHGNEGAGDGPASLFLSTPPRDFTKGVYKFRTTGQDGMPADLDLFRSITAGFPAYGMPSFRYLSEEDRWSLVYYVKSFYPNWEKFGSPEVLAVTEAHPEDEGAVERGKALYQAKFNCAQCHGAAGRGDGPRAAELKDHWGHSISPQDFTLGPTFRKAGWRRIDTVRMLMTGVPGTPMPSHIDQLADPKDLREFWDVARYVEYLTEEAQREK